MNNYTLTSSDHVLDPTSPIVNFNSSNTFVINSTSNTDLIKSYLTNPENGFAIEGTIETNTLIWAQGEFVDVCFETSDKMQSEIPGITVAYEFRETTIVDRWEGNRDGLCNFKVTRKIPTVYIILTNVIHCTNAKKVSTVPPKGKEYEGQRRRRDKRGSHRVGLVLDDTVNIKKYNKK